MTLPPADPVESAFEEVQAHARQHAVDTLLFRVRVGQALVSHLYAGDFRALHASLEGKDSLFSSFLRRHGGALNSFGLRPDTLRRCVAAAEAAEGLTETDFRELGFSRLVALASVEDPAWRRALIRQAVDQGWSVAELRAAIRQADDGVLTDADPERDGVQPMVSPDPPARPEPPSASARPDSVVSRLRGTAGAVDELAAWLQSQRGRTFNTRQREEVWRQVDAMDARLAAIKALLPPRLDADSGSAQE